MDHFDQTTTTMHHKFQCHQSFWAQYCAIINFNPALSMEKVHESLDGRLILAKFTLIDNSIPPFYVLNLYAPAEHNSRSKTMFFNNMISMIHSLPNSAAILPSLIIAGDFNYSFDNSSSHYTVDHPCTPLIDFVQHNLHDCFNVPGESFYDFTFTRGTSRSTIDYVFAGVNIYPHINDTHVEFMARSWTDHALLSFTYTVGLSTVGKGTWRADPTLATNPVYIKKLNQELDNYVQHKLLDSNSVQDQWDHIKRMVKKVTQNFCRFRAAKQQRLLRDLQSDRNRLLRNHRNDPVVLQSLLPDLDSQIAKIQQTRAKTYRLRAGKRWLEHNENSAGYLARTSTVRISSRNFQKIIHPVSGVACEDTESKLDAIHTFYTDLYTEKDIDMNCLETMLGFVQRQLSSVDTQSIIAEITMDDLLDGAKRCPPKSSPGLDGLPYEILHLILSNPHCHSIALQVYNEAITLARFPLSWQQACIALIPKKGDLADLANWRPISLINTDCKVFTRLLNARIVLLASSLITEYQASFMRDRFIGDHGLTNKLILEDAQKTTDTGLEFVGVMLDQTKAYDLIYPTYLAKVLERFGFPPAFVDCIQNLFFNNQIFVNMNGFLSPAVSQRRGLRQGDSISPMLFNFAIEPFLQSILVNPNIRGYSLQHGDTALTNDLHYVSPYRPVKLLAYADDVLLYVHSVAEFQALKHCLATYNKASNSLINYNKSVAFPLTGLSLSSPQGAQLQEFIVHNQRMRWYDASSTGHLPYLGFPIWFTIRQREAFTSSMIQKIESAFDPHRQRNLSMYGRATIANVLVLTKLWHILRITTLPKAFFQQVQSLVHQFLYDKMFPKMRSSIFYLPRNRGGLGILNVAVQQQVFQFRYIKALVNDTLSRATAVPPFLVQMLSDSLQVTYGAPNATLPLLFQGWRQPRRPRILFSFLPLLFQAVDACFPSRDYASIWPQIPPASACLSLPLREVLYCNPNHPDPPFKFSKHLSTLKVFEFFFFNPTDQLLHFRSTAECSFPGILRKLRNGVRSFRLLAHRFMAFHLGLIPFPASQSSTNIAQTRQAINSTCITTEPFLTTFLKTADTFISACTNHTIRQHILRSQPPIDHGRFYNPRIGVANWKSFLRTPMAPPARTLWYRLLQQKLSNKSSLAMIPGIVDSDRCVFCNQVETAEHLLISCPHKQDIWRPMLHLYLRNSDCFSLHRVYTDLCHLTLSGYLFRPSINTISILDFFSVVLYQIWRAHWRHHFDGVPLIPQHVFPSIHKDLIILTKQQQH